MDETTKTQLLEKNQKLIDMVIERAKRDFPEDIAIIGLTGSFATGDFHEKSDLDLIIINNTARGWDISFCFILGDVGYDIYCTPWETRIQAQSKLESPMVSSLIDLKILYCAKPEYMERFNQFRQNALDLLAKPIGKECIERARKHINLAKQEYANAMLAEAAGPVRYAAAGVLYNLVNAIVQLNNTCIRRGIKRYLEELSAYQYLPKEFSKKYMAVINSKTVDDLRSTSREILVSTENMYQTMCEKFIDQVSPTYENLNGSYEELWCNNRNKVLASVNSQDKSYAFQAAYGAQGFFEEMHKDLGTKKFDLMQHFNADDLQVFKQAFLQGMDEYLLEYEKVGRKVEKFDTFEELFTRYMQQ